MKIIGQKRANIYKLIEEVETLKGEARRLLRNAIYERVWSFSGSSAPFINSFANNFVITGGPGTGKSHAARVIAVSLNLVGLLLTDTVYNKGEPDLIAQFIGQTAPRVNSAVDQALEGVLFIDEAYAVTGCKHPINGWKQYGKEAADTLVLLMSGYVGLLSVVTAGYSREMQECFLRINDGFPRRFPTLVELSDYSSSDLFDILNIQVEQRLAGQLVDESNEDENAICAAPEAESKSPSSLSSLSVLSAAAAAAAAPSSTARLCRNTGMGRLFDATALNWFKTQFANDRETHPDWFLFQAGDMQNLADYVLSTYWTDYGKRRVTSFPSSPKSKLGRDRSRTLLTDAYRQYVAMKKAGLTNSGATSGMASSAPSNLLSQYASSAAQLASSE